MQRAKGITLAPGLILRQCQQRPAALPQRCLGYPSLGLAQDLAVMTAPEAGVEVDLLGVQAELTQPGRLGPAGVPVLQLAQRRARATTPALRR